ncbi:MAG TPA: hypothetical protein VKP03_02535, partial [Patescibacteria group bacterium]|nr:hypothetical protein [Patescibacteria group bacterium]
FLMYYLFLQGWWGVALFVAVIIIVGFYIFRLAFLYKHNKFIVTNQRIVDIEQPGFFEKYLNAFSFDKIKRSEAVVKGLGSMIFRYGNLKLHLKEDVGPFELYKVAKPLRLQQFINELLQDNRPKSSQKDLKPMDLIMEEAGFLNDGQKRKIIDLLEKQLDKEESKRD